MPHAPELAGLALDGRYELHAVIGEGTFGRVYRGLDRRLARPVAVKVIKPWWGDDPEWARTFEREAQLLASISDPGIVQIFDVGAAPEGRYYVAELVDGESLADRLRREPIAMADALDVAEQLARALSHAHARRIVHRDVKPANVLITGDGRIKVGDFGVARLAEGSSDGGATIAGTPRYMAPEQSRGDPVTPATDVYGVGVVLYEMLAGHPPFQGGSAVELALRHVNDPPPPLPPEVPDAVAAVVERALAKQPGARFTDGHDLAQALAAATAHASGRESLPATRVVNGTAATARTDRIGTEDTGADRTRVGQPLSPRRNVNPAERRQRLALFALVLVLGVGGLLTALALAPGHVKVPAVRGLARARVASVLRRAGLKASFDERYSASPRGTAIAQSPAAGHRVTDGSTVKVGLSAGPAPVPVPKLLGLATAAAQTSLGRLKLQGAVTAVPAPGTTAGIVVHQAPGAGTRLAPGSSVALSVAETPQWRALTSFSGTDSGHSVPFRIRGAQWRVVYSMGYQGTCTFVFICSGPSATVTDASSGAKVASFGLGEGSGKTQTVNSGPGVYVVSVSPGSDTASYSIRVQDHY
jgi:serine/threonine-protein kinase